MWYNKISRTNYLRCFWAPRTLGFLRHNLYNCTMELHEATYHALIRPTLEYTSAVWDPYLATDIRTPAVSPGWLLNLVAVPWRKTPNPHSDVTLPDTACIDRHQCRFHTTLQKQAFQRGTPNVSAISNSASVQVLFLPGDSPGLD